MARTKKADAANAGLKVDENSQKSSKLSTAQSQPKIDVADGFSVSDGLRQLGLIRPHGTGFEVYVNRDGELCYIATAASRAEALRLIREARNA